MRGLDARLRTRWDAIIESEGRILGLSDCRSFLENKMVNDIFYEGKFKGRDCIVKCSSKAPDSIANEYALSRRVFAANPSVTPEPLAYYASDDGRMAFIVTAKVKGPSLTELLTSGISDDDAIAYASDILHLAEALKETGIVHRDLFSDNLLLDADGHIKAIDFQFAIDRNVGRECNWMRKNWKYHYVTFARIAGQPSASWNDIVALRRIIQRTFPHICCIAEIDGMLSKMESSGFYRAEVTLFILPSAIAYIVSLYLQRLFCRNAERKAVIGKRMRIARELVKLILVEKT